MNRKRVVTISAISLAALVLIASGWLAWVLFGPVTTGAEDGPAILKIRLGTSFDGVMNTMVKTGLIRSEWRVRWTAKLMGWRGELKAGKYEIAPGTSSYALLKKLVDGDVTTDMVTIPEGLTSRQIAAILQRPIEIDSTEFMRLVNDSSFARQLGVAADRLEGFLYPDTYALHWGMPTRAVIRLMVNEFKERFDAALRERAGALGLSVLEAVTLASIIEGEAMVDSERVIISAVYHNRLQRGMRLQADPTIQYIIEDGPRRLLKRDLEIDSPYNTYKYPGLPPGPINNPGVASLEAAVTPADVDYLYFVATGDGSHTFSRTWQEHLKAKARFDAYRHQVERKKREEGRGREN